MDFFKQGSDNLKGMGFGSAMPTERDRLLGTVSGDTQAQNQSQMDAIQAQIDSENKKNEPKSFPAMKSGGKVGSASKRADGCAVKGKTKGTLIACGGGYMKGKK